MKTTFAYLLVAAVTLTGALLIGTQAQNYIGGLFAHVSAQTIDALRSGR